MKKLLLNFKTQSLWVVIKSNDRANVWEILNTSLSHFFFKIMSNIKLVFRDLFQTIITTNKIQS